MRNMQTATFKFNCSKKHTNSFRNQSNRYHWESTSPRRFKQKTEERSKSRNLETNSSQTRGEITGSICPIIHRPINPQTMNSVTMQSDTRGRKECGTTSAENTRSNEEEEEEAEKQKKKKKKRDSIGWGIRWEGIGMGVRQRNMLAQWLASARANWANAGMQPRKSEREREREREREGERKQRGWGLRRV